MDRKTTLDVCAAAASLAAQPLENADALIDSVETFIFDCDDFEKAANDVEKGENMKNEINLAECIFPECIKCFLTIIFFQNGLVFLLELMFLFLFFLVILSFNL
uniref:Uncharacterized protein n=1 Tax=Lactuca sativa TaxID=4236 RepID=A0A9R1VRV3_LACSA|nr:hypothetical protein LSAT_V11C400203930 [Lactuca sativa]